MSSSSYRYQIVKKHRPGALYINMFVCLNGPFPVVKSHAAVYNPYNDSFYF